MRSDPDFWYRIVKLEINVLALMALHGNLCLALRHPDNKGESRSLIIPLVRGIGQELVTLGAITPEQRKEAEAGLVVP